MVTLSEVISQVQNALPDCSISHFESRNSECIVARKEKGGKWHEAVLELWGLPLLTENEIAEKIGEFQEAVTSALISEGLS